MFNIFIFRLTLFVIFLIITTLNILLLSAHLSIAIFFSSVDAMIKFIQCFKESFKNWFLGNNKNSDFIFQPYFESCKEICEAFITPPFKK